ncbi:Fumarylacetoacetase [Penicillium paradoxum]|uniref:Fumarylacetoacetase n=1 Tax=Penicillium paradoxum TaxID=176176 RepID=UPI0025469A31|nr:Fumarylacetoacetase [Penicillium paradoxum]KAJ5793994.1 Fumarylacetoacetase [Penicillium paradoxum]
MSWLSIPKSSHFSLRNIPFGIISTATSSQQRPAIAIGEYAIDLDAFAKGGGFKPLEAVSEHLSVFSSPSLNAFAALGQGVHRTVRNYLQQVLADQTPYPNILKENQSLQTSALVPLKEVTLHLPLEVGDYTDFFAGINHAFKVGSLFRGPANALQPNYKHVPVAYHSRASSVVVSGTPVRRPWGQILTDPKAEPKIPEFIPCRRLDIELELGAFICRPSEFGSQIKIEDAKEHIFGYVLMNDWSARDIQTWEYVPLGPFNAKNFATTISGWVVLADALEPFRVPGIENSAEILPYLREIEKDSQYDIRLQVDLETKQGNNTTITNTKGNNLIWSFPQMLAHHSVSGCPMRTGDLLGSGTISGEGDNEKGSLLEQNSGGQQTIKLNGSEERKFLQDEDTIRIYGVCGDEEQGLVGFGVCEGQILPALSL